MDALDVDVDAEGTPLVGEEAEPRRKGSGAAVAMLVFALLLTVVGAWYSKEILEFVDAVCKDMKALRQDYGDGLVVALISGAMFLESLLPIRRAGDPVGQQERAARRRDNRGRPPGGAGGWQQRGHQPRQPEQPCRARAPPAAAGAVCKAAARRRPSARNGR